jgi:hypothetical protein
MNQSSPVMACRASEYGAIVGHLRLGRLKKTRQWSQVVALLEGAPYDTAGVVRATIIAADHQLRTLSKDPSLAYCFWVLTRITWAGRSTDFTSELVDLGLHDGAQASALTFIARLSDHVRTELARHPESGPVSEIASLSLKRSLTETVGTRGPSLFGSTVEDLQGAFRDYSTRRGFSELSQRFFGDFLSRTLRSLLDRELPNHIGPPHSVTTIQKSSEFLEAIDLYTRQSAGIVRDFAGGWYSKHNWESQGRISLEEASNFVAVALRKFRSELKRETA